MNKTLLWIFCLVLIGYGCYAVIPHEHIQPKESTRSLIGLSVSIKSFLFNKHPENVFFLRITGSKSNPKSELMVNNYSKGGRIYLINAKPGLYMAIASYHISTKSSNIGLTNTLIQRSLSVLLFPEEIVKASMVNVKPGEFVYMGNFVMNSDNVLEKCDRFQKISCSKLERIIEKAIPKGAKHSYCRGILKKSSTTFEKFLLKAKQDFQDTGWSTLLIWKGKKK